MHFMNVKQKLLIATLAGVMVTAGVGATKDTAHAAEADADADVVTTVDDAETGGNTADVSDDSTDDAEESADDETDDVSGEADSTDDAEGAVADVDDTEDADNADITDDADNTDTADDVDTADAADDADIAADVSDEKQKAPKDTLEVAATQNGWVTEGNYTYYYVDGVKVSNTVMEIDKKLYGFRSDGRRYEDASFSIGGKNYRAKADGTLYRSEWYSTLDWYNNPLWYYYCKDGAGADGIVTIAKKKYLFDQGQMCTGRAKRVSGYSYYGNEKGTPVKLNTNGWTNVSGKWFYCIGGQFLSYMIYEIDGKYYGFADTGVMFDDESFDGGYIPNNGGSFRAKKGGELYRNEWYKEKYYGQTVKYYYGANCAAPSGYVKVSGKYYYFGYGGKALADEITYNSSNSKWYVADKNGYAKEVTETTGWVEAGKGTWYYLLDGNPVKNQVIKIGKKYYGFGNSGKMYSSTTFSFTNDGVTGYYRAKADGSLYVRSWYQAPTGEWYYYGSKGVGVSGFKTIDGKNYYFESNAKLRNYVTTIEEGGVTYIIDAKGTGECVKVPDSGWFTVGQRRYYAQDGKPVKSTVLKIDSKYYAFNSDGTLAVNTLVSISGTYYRAKKTGELYENEWYGYEYFGEGGKRYESGYKEIGGKEYYFVLGKLQCSCYMMINGELISLSAKGVVSKVTKDGLYFLNSGTAVLISGGEPVKGEWKKIDGSYYFFQSYGTAATGSTWADGKYYVMMADGTMMKNGWIRTGSDTFYAAADGTLLTGEQKIDGKNYLFSSGGYMLTGFQKVNDKLWFYAVDGARVGSAFKTGWNEFQGEWYYLREGAQSPITSGEAEIEDHYYFFKDYVMQENYVNHSNGRIYGKNGQRVSEGWIRINGYWYYVKPDYGYFAYGCSMKIDGKTYHFRSDGTLITESFDQGGRHFKIGSDGAELGNLAPEEKWSPVGGYQGSSSGSYYYWKEPASAYFTGWVDDYYISSGIMLRNAVTPDGFLVGEDGKWIRKQGIQFIYPSSMFYVLEDMESYGYTEDELKQWYYVKSDGKIAKDEWHKVDGSWYYFNASGIMLRGPVIYNNKLYLTTLNGKWISTAEDPEGWYEYGSTWVYVRSGELLKNTSFTENGKTYYFDSYGRMRKNMVAYCGRSGGNGYYGKDGVLSLALTGWQKIGGKYFYFLKNGLAVNGWIHLGKQNYYIDTEKGMLTGTQVIDGQLYIFNENGALIKQVRKVNGWYEGTDGWYYFRSGYLSVSSEISIDGITYYFENGRMVANRIYKMRYLDKNGKAVRNCWKTVGGKKYYFGEDGKMKTGFQMVGGKVYLFDAMGRLIR